MKKRAIPARIPSPSDQLAALLRDCGRSPAALAAAAEVAPSILSRFLRGERSLSLDTVDRIATALGGLRLVAVGRRPGRGRPAMPANGEEPRENHPEAAEVEPPPAPSAGPVSCSRDALP